jgi:hypothetical protein
MQLQAIGLEQGTEELMQRHTKFSLKKCHTHHDVPPHRSRRCRILRHKTGSKLHHCHIPLTHEVLQVLPCDLWHGPTRLHHETSNGRRTTDCMLNNYLLLFKICFSIFSLFLFSCREGGRGTVGYRVGRCRWHRSDQLLYGPML